MHTCIHACIHTYMHTYMYIVCAYYVHPQPAAAASPGGAGWRETDENNVLK